MTIHRGAQKKHYCIHCCAQLVQDALDKIELMELRFQASRVDIRPNEFGPDTGEL